MSNPWETIELDDYESHMNLKSIRQLGTLNKIMKEQFDTYDVATVMILGIAGGNGLEHIRKDCFQKVYGIDVNNNFLQECRCRYGYLGEAFEPICTDLGKDNLQLPNAELLVANLLIEYIGYECFKQVVKIVKPKYISCVIQINEGNSFVSDSPYIHAFDCLEEVHHKIDTEGLVNSMYELAYDVKMITESFLPNEKKFIRIDFAR